ncbi:FkbM family methyltransferase [Mangrovivirga sp. M17]|uniref:FkbM family methyltransferase n=1 Tax=Mangrovivirga halotolerans TaxID=2993936 RepID=A0ABT3RP50_9BACT|nr:FkbM family methyltransferase [Mangrovivirga halotolerans]MCX2743313.1 FkbM family methyltransferase [Mangrovivirga halotolerans]
MFNYLKESFKRKRARRITQEYPPRVDEFNLSEEGLVKFANWENPLVPQIELTQSEVNFFKKFIKRGDVVIDIGANIGDLTVPMALASGKEGVVFGFDPNPFVYKILQKNAELNQDKTNIVPLLNAISSDEGEYYYTSSEASFANGGISTSKKNRHGKFVYPEKIKGIDLTKYLKEKHSDLLDKLSFIKIDTEGYDKEIIKSISPLIKEYKPYLVAESFGKSSDEDKKELFEVIKQLDYDIFYFEDFIENTKTKEIKTPEDMVSWKQTIDVYAMPKDK